MNAPVPAPPLSPSPSLRPARGGAVAVHLGGAVLFVAATAAAAVAGWIVSFGTSTCNQVDVSDNLRSLRLGLVVVGVLWTLVPTGWALLARRLRFTWALWAAVAAVCGLVTVVVVASAEVGTFCF
jgi:hypothetical protein